MYCNKKNLNILCSLLVKHGVRHVVVCPGSRNAPLVHNFNQCPELVCHPVTDERSAGFVALGLRQQCNGPVAVCVTSGTALLNLLPAVAEASYQQSGIVVISADRPAAWVDQLDGQTLPQPDALGRFAAVSVSLPECQDDPTEAWHCNRLVNEALLANKAPGHPSVHINVPISEPLFDFSVQNLPDERIVQSGAWNDDTLRAAIISTYEKALHPMIVMGQLSPADGLSHECIAALARKAVILSEPISMEGLPASYTDQMLATMEPDSTDYRPDWILYVGGHSVSKRMRKYLRAIGPDAVQIMVSPDGRLRDVSQHTEWLIVSEPSSVLKDIAILTEDASKTSYIAAWEKLRSRVAETQAGFNAEYSQMLAVMLFEEKARTHSAIFHYANSMSVRLAALYARGYCFCNRGVNGIEGSLSVAAGASLADPSKRVYCVIGDLSFFYDQNALWQSLEGNLRILLLNNQQGGIFKTLPGLENSPVCDTMVAGRHDASAEGACMQHDIAYYRATDTQSLEEGLTQLVESCSTRPVLLEVCTDAEIDSKEYKRLYRIICGQ